MKYREILIDQLKVLPYFDKKMVYDLSDQYGLKVGTVDAYVNRSLVCKELIQLKKGTYVTDAYFKIYKNDISYIFYLANILRQPSYVSSWTALQYYDLTTEVIYPVISVTTKITRNYQNKVGNFAYHSMKKSLFLDFSLVKGSFDFFIATPAKALFDLVYFKTNQFKGLKIEDVKMLVEDLRVDIDEMGKKEREKFYMMVKKQLK
ncbi:hypothetical protein KKG65_00805 [Patescibacteria group bacterium]|nr:hypothetical protein [Patescibacteria group bacterium]